MVSPKINGFELDFTKLFDERRDKKSRSTHQNIIDLFLEEQLPLINIALLQESGRASESKYEEVKRDPAQIIRLEKGRLTLSLLKGLNSITGTDNVLKILRDAFSVAVLNIGREFFDNVYEFNRAFQNHRESSQKEAEILSRLAADFPMNCPAPLSLDQLVDYLFSLKNPQERSALACSNTDSDLFFLPTLPEKEELQVKQHPHDLQTRDFYSKLLREYGYGDEEIEKLCEKYGVPFLVRVEASTYLFTNLEFAMLDLCNGEFNSAIRKINRMHNLECDPFSENLFKEIVSDRLFKLKLAMKEKTVFEQKRSKGQSVTYEDYFDFFIAKQQLFVNIYFSNCYRRSPEEVLDIITGKEEQRDPMKFIRFEEGLLTLTLLEMGEKFLKTNNLDFLDAPRTAFIRSILKIGYAYSKNKEGFERAFENHRALSDSAYTVVRDIAPWINRSSDAASSCLDILRKQYAYCKTFLDILESDFKEKKLEIPQIQRCNYYEYDAEVISIWLTILSKYEEDNKGNEWQLRVLESGDYNHSKFFDHLVDLYFSGQEPQDVEEREQRKSRWSTAICGSAHKHTKYPEYARFSEEGILEEIKKLEILGSNLPVDHSEKKTMPTVKKSKYYEQDAEARAVWSDILAEYEEERFKKEVWFTSLEGEYFNYSKIIDQLADLCFSSHQLQKAEERRKARATRQELAFMNSLGNPSAEYIEDYQFSEEELLEEIRNLEILSRNLFVDSDRKANSVSYSQLQTEENEKKYTHVPRKPDDIVAFVATFLSLDIIMLRLCAGEFDAAAQMIRNLHEIEYSCENYTSISSFEATVLDALSAIKPDISGTAETTWQNLKKELFEKKQELPPLEVICGDTSRRAVSRLAGNKIKEGLVIVRTYDGTDVEQRATALRDVRKSRFAQEGLGSLGMAPVEIDFIERDNLLVHAEKIVPGVTLNVLGDTGLIPLRVEQNVIQAIHTYQTVLTELFNSKRDDAEIRYAIDHYDVQHYVDEFDEKFIRRLQELSEKVKLSFDLGALREAVVEAIRPLQFEPDVVTHGDVRGQNILVKPDNSICFIDFEKMAVRKRIFDYLNFVEHSSVELKNFHPSDSIFFSPYHFIVKLFETESGHTKKKESTSLQKELDFLQKLAGSFIPSSDSKDYRPFFFNEILPIAAVLQIGHQIGSVIKYHQTAEKWYSVGRQRVLQYLDNYQKYLGPVCFENDAINEISSQFSSLHRQIEQGIFRTI